MYVLNTSIITEPGSYEFININLKEVKILSEMVKFESAVGHESTAKVLTDVLGQDIKFNRIDFKQSVGETVLIAKTKKRGPEGKILTVDQLKDIGMEYGLLKRTK